MKKDDTLEDKKFQGRQNPSEKQEPGAYATPNVNTNVELRAYNSNDTHAMPTAIATTNAIPVDDDDIDNDVDVLPILVEAELVVPEDEDQLRRNDSSAKKSLLLKFAIALIVVIIVSVVSVVVGIQIGKADDSNGSSDSSPSSDERVGPPSQDHPSPAHPSKVSKNHGRALILD